MAASTEEGGEDVVFDVDDDEIEDVNVVSENARPGKPRLDRILDDEVQRAKGAIAVACQFKPPSFFLFSRHRHFLLYDVCWLLMDPGFSFG